MRLRKQVLFTEIILEKVEDLIRIQGYPSFTAVIHQAVIEMHKKNTPPLYAQKKNKTPEEQVADGQRRKEAKEALVREEKLDIIKTLEGELLEEAGTEYCVYFTYVNRQRFDQKVPFSVLSADLAKTQYVPSRTKVLKLQEDKKVDY